MINRLNTLRELANTFESSRSKTSGLASRSMERMRETTQNVAYTLRQDTDRRMAEWVAAIRENRATPAKLEFDEFQGEATIGGGRFVYPPSRPGMDTIGDTGVPEPPARPEDYANFYIYPESLIETESGGDLTAYNDIVGFGGYVGHGGRLQFGGSRLKEAADAGVIPEMSALEFSQQPLEVQEAVEQWHFRDINRYIDRKGLDRFIGTEIAGVPITRNGIIAMAHLGGSPGARRFLESDGEYNPSDGTTYLSDYARIHQ